MSDLQEVLEGTDETNELTEVQEETQGENQESQETTGEQESGPPPEEKEDREGSDPKEAAYWAAVADERKKRQALEQELEDLKRNMSGEKQEKPDFWENPDAAVQHQIMTVKQEMDDRFYNLSESNARTRHEDFDDVKEFFFDKLSAENPALVEEAKRQPDPYEWIYQTARKQKAMSEMGDPDSYKEKLKQELASEYEARIKELEAKLEETSKGKLPGSLSEARSAGGGDAPASDALEDVLGR